MDSFDVRKHSAVIAHFNQYHVHTGDFPDGTYKVIDSAFVIREKCDYSDFYVVSKNEAEKQYQDAVQFVNLVVKFLEEKKVEAFDCIADHEESGQKAGS